MSYDGSAYCGWQKQACGPTVQGAVEEALQRLLKHPVGVVGCGRTDTGVHARSYFAHFDWEGEEIGFEKRIRLMYSLNALLGKAVAGSLPATPLS